MALLAFLIFRGVAALLLLAVAVGDQAAEFHDQQSSIAVSLPLGLAILVLSTLLILWPMTGTIILPIKAFAMNALIVGAALGLLVLVFQHGRLSGAPAYTSQGWIESTDFLVLAAIALGLSTSTRGSADWDRASC